MAEFLQGCRVPALQAGAGELEEPRGDSGIEDMDLGCADRAGGQGSTPGRQAMDEEDGFE